MSLSDFLLILWRRKLIALVVTLLVVGVAVGALRFVTPQYEASSTLVLTPDDERDSVFLLQVLTRVVPIYADAATSHTTEERAEEIAGHEVGDISVQTFTDTSIMRINARHPSPRIAQRSAQAVTDALLERSRRGDVGIAALTLRQVDRPVLPTDPVVPQTTLTLLVAVLLGLSFGAVVAVLREHLSTRIETPETLARVADLPVYGEIPANRRLEKRYPPEAYLDPRLRAASEAFRDLRTNLVFANDSLRSLAITSPEGSHGKTTVSVGLAVSFARAGARTLLIDADLRRGRTSELLEMPRTPGLLEVLSGYPLQDALHPSSLDGLTVMPGGALGEDPGELLASEFPSILLECESLYDMVVVDCTPLLPISDARVVGRYAQGTLVVAAAGASTRRELRKALDRLSLISVRPIGMVLNRYSAQTKSAYYEITPKAGAAADRARTPLVKQ